MSHIKRSYVLSMKFAHVIIFYIYVLNNLHFMIFVFVRLYNHNTNRIHEISSVQYVT